MFKSIFTVMVLAVIPASGFADDGGIFFYPTAGIGTNSAQETFYRLGVDLGYYYDENISFGVSGFYAAGSHPEHDRSIGAGPFVGYSYPLLKFLSLNLREDLDYVDQRNPIKRSDGSYTHDDEAGVASTTYAGVHIRFTRNLGVSIGYALVVGITNSDLGDGRSGVSAGISLGI